MKQAGLSFESDPVPFQAGSWTSFKAARTLAHQGTRGEKIRRLLQAYRDAGERGANDSEIEAATGLLRSSICSLRAAVAVCGLIEKAGERLGGHGHVQQVWAITGAGKVAAR